METFTSERTSLALDDPYYAPLVREHSELLAGAGFIERPLKIDERLNLLTVPLENLQESEEPVSVIYYTGCFAPIHEGHRTAMRLARETIERETGERVVLGVFAPDHDSYVLSKPGTEPYHAFERLERAYALTSEDSWLAVDSFPALYAPMDLNFTTLLQRFENLIATHAPRSSVKVYFLFGGDNAEFANAFTERGQGVCVLRPGASLERARILDSARVLFSDEFSSNHSSTAERERIAREAHEEQKVAGDYYLRGDLAHTLPEALRWWSSSLHEGIQEALERFTPESVTVRALDVTSQLRTQFPAPTISLDTLWRGDHEFAISRRFLPASGQYRGEELVERPGHEALKVQASRIPAGEYTLVDDDVASGYTVGRVREILAREGVTITSVGSLTPKFADFCDVVDARDFIVGTANGGLVMRLRGKLTRMPYMLPYVNLHTRASFATSEVRAASDAFWLLNRQVHRASGLTVGDVRANQDFTLLGFPEAMPLSELAEYHLISR